MKQYLNNQEQISYLLSFLAILVQRAGLMTIDENGRYQVNQAEIGRLKTLSSLRR